MTSPVDSNVSAAAGAGSPGVGRLASRVAQNTGLLAASQIACRALGMVLMIMLARYLRAEGYGTYQRAEAFVYMFSVLANLGLDMILTREVARGAPRSNEYFSGILALKVGLALVAYAVVVGIASVRGYSGEFLFGIHAYAISLVFNALAQVFEAMFLGLQVMRSVAVVNLVTQSVLLVLGVGCIALGKDLRWIMAVVPVAAAVRLAVGAVLLWRRKAPWIAPRLATIGYLLREAAPLAVAASCVIVYQQVDAVMLGEMRGNAEVGWYKAGVKFLLLYTVLRESFMLSVYPIFSSLAHTDRDRLGSIVTRAARYQVIVALYFVLTFVFLPSVAPRLLGYDFLNSAAVLPILAWILVPQTLSITAGRVLTAAGQQNRLMLTTGLSLAVNVAANLLLIPRYGFLGAAVSGVLSESLVAALNLHFVNRFVTHTSILRALAKPALAAALAGAALVLFLREMKLYYAFPLSAVAYAAALMAVRTFSRAELHQFRALLSAAAARVRGRRGPAPRELLADSWLEDREG